MVVADFVGDDFFGARLVADFLATDFLAADFLTTGRFATAFLNDFFAGLLADFLADFFAATLLLLTHAPCTVPPHRRGPLVEAYLPEMKGPIFGASSWRARARWLIESFSSGLI